MEEAPLLASVIMATRNKSTYLDLTLASLARQTLPTSSWEVVVTDDASIDDTADVLRRYDAEGKLRLKWRSSARCRGRAGARNDALALAQGTTVVFLDDDRIVKDDFLFWHLLHHGHGPRIVMGDISSYIHTHVGPEIDARMWTIASVLSRAGRGPGDGPVPRRIVFAEDLDHPERLAALTVSGGGWASAISMMDRERVPYPSPWVYFTTGNASIPRDHLEAIGGFDEGYVGWGLEDNDVFVRLQQRGLPVRYEGRAVTLHQKHSKGNSQEEEYQNNFERFMRKFPELDTADNRLLCRGGFNLTQWIDSHKEMERGRSRRAAAKATSERLILWCVPPTGLMHAKRGVALFRELRRVSPEFGACWVTSGGAARWLREQGYNVRDMGADTPRARFDTYASALQEYQPTLAVSDGEPLLLPLAHQAGVPSVYVSTRLEDADESAEASYMGYARRILFPDTPDGRVLPRGCFSRVDFCGPWVEDRHEGGREYWRAMLNGTGRSLILINLRGGGDSAEKFALEVSAAVLAQMPTASVAVLSDRPHESLRKALPLGMLLLDGLPDPVSFCLAADVVITPDDPSLLWELVAAGVAAVVAPQLGNDDERAAEAATRMSKLTTSILTLASGAGAAEIVDLIGLASARQVEEGHPVVDFAGRRRAGAESLLACVY